MYILVNKDNIIVGCAAKKVDEAQASTNGQRVFEIDSEDFDIEMIGQKLEDFDIE